MEPPGLERKLDRRTFSRDSNVLRLIRHPDLERISLTLKDARTQRNSECKRLIFIEGEAGIGKSWFLGYLNEYIQNNHGEWQILGPYEAEPFLNQNPNYQFVRLMNECAGRELHPVVPNQQLTEKDVLAHAEALEFALTNQQNEPLLILFDELEWWVDVNDTQKDTLNRLFRIVWRVLLRQYSMPCVIICAGRRSPEFRDVLLKRALSMFPLQGLPDVELVRILSPIHSLETRTAILHRANGNPWVTQLLDFALTRNPTALNDLHSKENTLRWAFDNIVTNRLNNRLHRTLYELARFRPNGFHEDDQLLNNDVLMPAKLVRTSFVDYDLEGRKYQIARVLTNLFRE